MNLSDTFTMIDLDKSLIGGKIMSIEVVCFCDKCEFFLNIQKGFDIKNGTVLVQNVVLM